MQPASEPCERAVRTERGSWGPASERVGGTAGAKPPGEFTTWLSDYLERRIRVAAWLLDHWDATPPLVADSVVARDQFVATLERWQAILHVVAADRGLRARLHWDNGVLAQEGPTDRHLLATAVDWPAELQFTTPVRGAFGLFLGEAIANAIRHGAPGSEVRLSVTCDRVRRELQFVVANPVRHEAVAREGDAYGGVAMLEATARLCEWRDLRFEPGAGEFRVSWRIPVSERAGLGAD